MFNCSHVCFDYIYYSLTVLDVSVSSTDFLANVFVFVRKDEMEHSFDLQSPEIYDTKDPVNDCSLTLS